MGIAFAKNDTLCLRRGQPACLRKLVPTGRKLLPQTQTRRQRPACYSERRPSRRQGRRAVPCGAEGDAAAAPSSGVGSIANIIVQNKTATHLTLTLLLCLFSSLLYLCFIFISVQPVCCFRQASNGRQRKTFCFYRLSSAEERVNVCAHTPSGDICCSEVQSSSPSRFDENTVVPAGGALRVLLFLVHTKMELRFSCLLFFRIRSINANTRDVQSPRQRRRRASTIGQRHRCACAMITNGRRPWSTRLERRKGRGS